MRETVEVSRTVLGGKVGKCISQNGFMVLGLKVTG